MKIISDIGILGGTFDPVHVGHLRTALAVGEELALDEVRLVPCARPAHKDRAQVSDTHRLAMLKLAVTDVPALQVDERECQRPGISYLYDTLKSLHREFPGNRFYFILGSDAFNTLTSWYRWQELLDLCHWVLVARPGCQVAPDSVLQREYESRLQTSAAKLKHSAGGYILETEPSPLDVSSTLLREKIAQGRSLRYLIPDVVIDYIRQHNLYA